MQKQDIYVKGLKAPSMAYKRAFIDQNIMQKGDPFVYNI